MKDFTEISLNKNNLDRWYIRKSIFDFLDNSKGKLQGHMLDIGCGKMPYKEFLLNNSRLVKYTGLDIESALIYDESVTPDFTWNGKEMPFQSDSFDCALGTEVLEHCPEPEVVLKEVLRILKPGGVFYFTVPFLWNLHEVPNDEYRYTPFSLKRHLVNSGFEKIELQATGGWHASLAQMLGLWVRRSEMPESKRKLLSYILKPIIKYLVKIDKPEEVNFKDGQMISGISGYAVKAMNQIKI